MYFYVSIIEDFNLLNEFHDNLLEYPLILEIEMKQILHLFFKDLDVCI